MKKLMIIVISMVLGFYLWGCAEKPQSSFDEKTNQKESVQGINYQVPEAWEKKVDNGEYIEYVDESEGTALETTLTVTFAEDADIDKEISMYEPNDTDKKLPESISDFRKSDLTIASMDAKKIEFTQTIKGEEAIEEIVLVQTSHGVFEMLFSSISEERGNDFDKVIESIMINGEKAN